MGLNLESSNHSQPMVPREMGVAQGRMISMRAIHLPRKSSESTTARTLARIMIRIFETTVK